MLEFMNEIHQQDKMILSYGMTDERYKNSFNELISTLCIRLFHRMVGLILGVLEKMRTDHFKEGKVFLTSGIFFCLPRTRRSVYADQSDL